MPTSTPASSQFDFSPHLRADDVVTWLQGTGEPLGLTGRLCEQRRALPPLTLFFGIMASKTLKPEYADRFRFHALNGAGNNRTLTGAGVGGVADIVPVHVSAAPALIRSRTIRVDVLLLRVRPHPKPGYYTAGVMVDFLPAMLAAARCVIAEIDERLPITANDALVPADKITAFAQCDAGEVLMPDPEPSEVEMQVARHVASLIPDGATIQLGIGGLPVAVCRALDGHKALGVHSGVIPDAVVDLVEKGVITNTKKSIDAGRIVTGGLFGTQRLTRFANGNPMIEMRSSEYTHNQQVLARIENLYAINSGVEVDLTGNVNSEIAGGRYLGAIGGQADYVRGGFVSPGGRSIIALPSTTPDGKTSRIVASLEGRPVTTTRSDIDIVVTEHGVADLRGRTFSERAARMRAIAHPQFRDTLQPR